MMKFGIGQAVPRTEDGRLVTGGGRFTDDITLPNAAYAAVLRSVHAHGALTTIDTAAAAAAPGVLAVFTSEDLDRDGIGTLKAIAKVTSRDGSPMITPPRPALARNTVRHVGDPIAVVVAESHEAARDALELIEVSIDDRPAVTDTAGALAADAPQVWPQAPGNLCFDWERGDAGAVDRAFAKADRVVRLDLINNRVVANSMEPRVAIADYDPAADVLTLYVSSQGVHGLRGQLCTMFGRSPEQMRVVTPDVGGGFGMKIFMYPEYPSLLYAALKLGRPVRWSAERTEGFISDDHGRDHVTHAELALDTTHRFLGLRVSTIANLGAYLSNFGAFIPTDAGSGMLPGVYDMPSLHVRVRGVFTNTVPVDAYRGAGRPEAAYVIERLVDMAAREIGIAPADLRRLNYIAPDQMPYDTAGGKTYDSGEFGRLLDVALDRADVAGFAERRRLAAERGRLRGLGLATYIEACAGGAPEEATLEVTGNGRITLLIGTQSNGQGHETAYKQIIVDRLGVDPDQIEVIQGDSARVTFGKGTGGSRSGPVGGAALADSADKLIATATIQAADVLEAAVADIVFAEGRFTIAGTDRSASFTEVARAVAPADGGLAFRESAQWQPPAGTYPNGTHVCEVEIDRETGVPEIVKYTVVDDFGAMINPLLVAGQVHGGIGQGIGQALFEHCLYDPDSGQLITGAFTDYCMPRADQIAPIDLHFEPVPCRTNPLGMKGAGEAGAIGAPPAVINAIVDALADYGVRHVDMPATPEKLWKLIT